MHPLPDIINGWFEAISGGFMSYNCVRLYQDKRVRGVSVATQIFFTAWGYWNLFYYPHLGQWFSFFCGWLIVVSNTLWVTLAIKYRNN